MATERQIAANKKNAQSSTGPRSMGGKLRSSQNAVKHGLTGHGILMQSEDPEKFEKLCQAMWDRYSPSSHLEEVYVERAAGLLWRLMRIPAIEAVLHAWIAHREFVSFDAPVASGRGAYSLSPNQNDSLRYMSFKPTPALALGRTVEALLDIDSFNKIARYETALQKQLALLQKELAELEANRSAPTKLAESPAQISHAELAIPEKAPDEAESPPSESLPN